MLIQATVSLIRHLGGLSLQFTGHSTPFKFMALSQSDLFQLLTGNSPILMGKKGDSYQSFVGSLRRQVQVEDEFSISKRVVLELRSDSKVVRVSVKEHDLLDLVFSALSVKAEVSCDPS